MLIKKTVTTKALQDARFEIGWFKRLKKQILVANFCSTYFGTFDDTEFNERNVTKPAIYMDIDIILLNNHVNRECH